MADKWVGPVPVLVNAAVECSVGWWSFSGFGGCRFGGLRGGIRRGINVAAVHLGMDGRDMGQSVR